MNTKFKNKLKDLFNSSFSENTKRKSQNNIFSDENTFLRRRIQTSSSSPKYQLNNSFSIHRNNKRDNIKEILNKSLNDYGINIQRNTNKKTLFDDINTTLNKKKVIKNQDFDYDEYFSKISEQKRKKSFNDLLNANNDLLNNISKSNKKDVYKNYTNNGSLLKKISAFTSEIQIENPFLEKVRNKNIIHFEKNNHLKYNEQLNQGRYSNFSKGNLSSNSLNHINNLFSNNKSSYSVYKYNAPSSLKSLYNKNNKIYIKDARDKVIDNFMNKNGRNQRNNNGYFSTHQKINSKTLNLNF